MTTPRDWRSRWTNEDLSDEAQAFLKHLATEVGNAQLLNLRRGVVIVEKWRDSRRVSLEQAFEQVLRTLPVDHANAVARNGIIRFKAFMASRASTPVAVVPVGASTGLADVVAALDRIALRLDARGTVVDGEAIGDAVRAELGRLPELVDEALDLKPVLTEAKAIRKSVAALEALLEQKGESSARLDQVVSQLQQALTMTTGAAEIDDRPTRMGRPPGGSHDAPAAFIRTQFEAILRGLGVEGTAAALDCSLAPVRKFKTTGAMPALDLELLDQVYVATRFELLDLEDSHVRDRVREVLKTTRRRELAEAAESRGGDA